MGAAKTLTVGEMIIAKGRHRTFEPREAVFVEGDHSRRVYAVVDGRVKIFLTMPSGRELLVAVKIPGEEFGELSALDGDRRSASAAALDRAVVAELGADRFLEEVMASPQYLLAVTRNLSAQLRRANRRLVTRNSDSAVVRTGRMIVELGALMMRHSTSTDPAACEVPITQTDLADWVGTTRESTARALAKFRRAGLVKTSRGCIVVVDVVGLSRFVSEC
jgi:CRP/FNR family transcriptional regulator, cyclic AMP receptor protein